MAFRSQRQAASAAVLLGAMVWPGDAPATQTTITISTTSAPATPRIQAPLVFSAFPGSPLLFAIPATGQAPLSYSATGLPSGLSLGSGTGIISGTMPAAGSYPVNVTVTNSIPQSRKSRSSFSTYAGNGFS